MTTALRWLFLDLDAFFASCEQELQPELRGHPVGVVPVETDSTCLIAASYEARPFGLKTGVKVSEAKQLCPQIKLVQARPKKYVEFHHKVLEAIERCLPHDGVRSIDEVACRLTGREQERGRAEQLAREVKQSIWTHAGEALNCSIGLSTNPFLAKLGCTMGKPNGLVTLLPEDLPGAIRHLRLSKLPGIGPRMEKRLWRSGISTMEELYACDAMRLRSIWGGVVGTRYYGLLRGHDIAQTKNHTQSLGHQHVLEPALRTPEGGYEVLRRLLEKATERLRRSGYYTRALTVQIKLTQQQGNWEREMRFPETQDTAVLLGYLKDIWVDHVTLPPLRVGVMLHGLVPVSEHQYHFFESPRKERALRAVDSINARYGRNTIHVGLHHHATNKIGKDKIAFQRVPDAYEV